MSREDETQPSRRGEAVDPGERRFKLLVRHSGDLFVVTDRNGVIDLLEGPVDDVLGIAPDVLIGTDLFALVQPEELPRAKQRWARRITTKDPMPAEEYWTRRADGSWICLSLLASNLLDDADLSGIVVTARDVTVVKHIENAREALSKANTALVHATNENALFSEICRVIEGARTYHMAWVGLTDPDADLGIRVAATAGDDSIAYLEALQKLARGVGWRGPLAIATETRQIQIVQDIAALPATTPWQELALAHGYRSLIVLPIGVDDERLGVLAIYSRDPQVFTDDAVHVLNALADDVAFGINTLRTRADREAYRTQLEASLEAAVRAIAAAAELRDPYTAGHQRRVAELAVAIATELSIDDALTDGIGVAALIHDIGKIATPTDLLNKPGKLTDAEFAVIRQHPRAGHDIVMGIDFPWPVAEMILQHHERFDGSGYPHGLEQGAISIGARIIAVADTVEAMMAHRPYRPGLGIETALSQIAADRGTRLDPDAVDACRRLFSQGRFRFSI